MGLLSDVGGKFDAISGPLQFGLDVWSAKRASDEAEFNRDWQASMRRTQYQTAVEDMKKAGINPMLAYMQGGAGTPSGAVGQVPSVSGGVSTALQARRLNRELTLMDEQIRERSAEADISEAEKAIVENERTRSNIDINNYMRMYHDSDVADPKARNWLLHSMRESLKGDISSSRQIMAAEPEAVASEKFWKSIAGDPAKWMQLLRSVLPAVRMSAPSSARQFSVPYLRRGKR